MSSPMNPAGGVYVNVPSVFSVTVPPAVVVIVCAELAATPVALFVSWAIAITSPSGSVSLLITLLLSGTSTNKPNVSSVAIGGVLSIVVGSVGSTGPFRSRTSIDTVAVSVLPNVSMTV